MFPLITHGILDGNRSIRSHCEHLVSAHSSMCANSNGRPKEQQFFRSSSSRFYSKMEWKHVTELLSWPLPLEAMQLKPLLQLGTTQLYLTWSKLFCGSGLGRQCNVAAIRPTPPRHTEHLHRHIYITWTNVLDNYKWCSTKICTNLAIRSSHDSLEAQYLIHFKGRSCQIGEWKPQHRIGVPRRSLRPWRPAHSEGR